MISGAFSTESIDPVDSRSEKNISTLLPEAQPIAWALVQKAALSSASVVEGEIHYPPTPYGDPAFTGQLVYIKFSVSGPDIPVHLANYLKEHDAFPHENTADQFFDDAQFEAYRALDEHCGYVAADKLQH